MPNELEENNELKQQMNSSKDLEIILEQYKLYVKMADNISSRRDKINKFYTSVLTVILTMTTFLFNEPFSIIEMNELTLAFISLLGIGLCLNWFMNIKSYKKLNSAKFDIINELENYLPFKGYTKEYKILRERKDYRNLSSNEKRVPIILIVVFIILLLYALYSYC